MSNKVTLTPHFESRYKRFAKKFTSLEREMDALIDSLTETPTLGESLGGGFRVVSYLITETADSIEIFLLTIYDKSEEGSIKKETLVALAKTISEE